MEQQKTPVTILQEMMIKIGSRPYYDVCETEIETLPKTFTFKVTCNGISTTGSGRSKKDAKQAAAKSMLQILNRYQNQEINNAVALPQALEQQSDSITLSAEIPLINIVQELQNLCEKYRCKQPIFKEELPVGPMHAQTHKVQCIVSTYIVEGIGKSKREAKYEAALKMIEKLNDTFCLHYLPSDPKRRNIYNSNGINTLCNSNTNSTDESTKLKISYDLKMQGKSKEKSCLNQSVDISTLKLEQLLHFIKQCDKNTYADNVTRIKQEFQNILDSANIDFDHMLLQSNGPTTFMLIIQLNTTPDILEMALASTKEEAEIRTISKVLLTLKNTLK